MSITDELIATITNSLKDIILKCEECITHIIDLDNACSGHSVNRTVLAILNISVEIEESIEAVINAIVWEYPRLEAERKKISSLFLESECELVINIGFRIGASLGKDYSYQFGQRETDHKSIVDKMTAIGKNSKVIIQEIANNEGDLISLIGEYY